MTKKLANTKLAAVMLLTAGVLAGCNSTNGVFSKIDNGSLNYQNTKLLAPIELPQNQQSQPFTPIYPTIDLGESSFDVANESGKQYQLPAPQRTVTN